MTPSPGRMPPWASLTVLGVLAAAAAGVGAWQAPGPPNSGPWQRALTSTTAAGPLAFSTVSLTVGADGASTHTFGWIDFTHRDAEQLSVLRSPATPAQWSQTVVVGGTAFDRPGVDGAGSRFRGAWTRLATFSVAPFAPLAGGPEADPPVGGPGMTALGTGRVEGVIATEYRLSPLAITCMQGAGVESTESVSSRVWVDGDDRIVRFETLVATSAPGLQNATLTVTDFSRFGEAVAVGVPRAVAGWATGPPAASDPLAGCLITPG